jgi:hypothetical protein
MQSSGHPSDEQIERYSMGTLADEELAQFEQHYLICHTCQDRVAESDSYTAAMKAAATANRRAEAASRKSRALFSSHAVAIAAAALVVLVSGAAWKHHSPAAIQQPLAVRMETVRGTVGAYAAVPAGRPLLLQLDTAGLPGEAGYRVEVVGADGTRVWQAAAQNRNGTASALMPKPPRAGSYFVRLYGGSPDLLREYGLRVDRATSPATH